MAYQKPSQEWEDALAALSEARQKINEAFVKAANADVNFTLEIDKMDHKTKYLTIRVNRVI